MPHLVLSGKERLYSWDSPVSSVRSSEMGFTPSSPIPVASTSPGWRSLPRPSANLLEARRVRPPELPAHVAGIVLGGLALGAACRLLRPVVAIAVGLAVGVAYLVVVVNRFAADGTWLPLVVPLFLQIRSRWEAQSSVDTSRPTERRRPFATLCPTTFPPT